MSRCSKAVKAFQRLLVYEPIKEPCNVCDRLRPYPSAPPFGTSIKVCTFKEMERLCFPKLCDCPCREIPLCPDAQRRQNLCMAVYWLATLALFAFLFDSGIFRHPVYTVRMTDSVWERVGELFDPEEGREASDVGRDPAQSEQEKNQEAAKRTENKPKPNPKTEYEKATKVYNVKNVWNATVVGLGDIFIAAVQLPQILVAKTMEKIAGGNEEETATKDLAHQQKKVDQSDRNSENQKKNTENPQKQHKKDKEPTTVKSFVWGN